MSRRITTMFSVAMLSMVLLLGGCLVIKVEKHEKHGDCKGHPGKPCKVDAKAGKPGPKAAGCPVAGPEIRNEPKVPAR